MKIINKKKIIQLLSHIDLVTEIEQAFVAHANDETVVPPVGELLFSDPPGDAHIKYGYLKNSRYYVIKMASGFYQNPKIGLASSQGLMLVFDKQTGVPVCLLNDEGLLTDVRTAVAGAIAAKYLAPNVIKHIGIVGTGTQAKWQLHYLQQITDCRSVMVFGRHEDAIKNFKQYFVHTDYNIMAAARIDQLAEESQLIVTTTPSTTPHLLLPMIQPGTHITAIGSDTPEKQELDGKIVARADIVVADCLKQARQRGEISHAINHHRFGIEKVKTMGDIIQNPALGRGSGSQVTVADFTGIAPQDIVIAECIYKVSQGG